MSGGLGAGAVRWEDVGFAYPDAAPVFDGIELEVADGEVALLVGDSGSGKSTLLRTVNALVPRSTGGRFRGRVVVGAVDVSGQRPRDLAGAVGFVHQDPEAQVVVDEVEHDVAFALENLGVPAAEMRRRVEEVLDAVGIAHLRHRSPATLSGGERQRAAVAGALAAGPAVLVLDEPTSMLDPQGADDVLAAVARLADDLGTTVVMAEHRLERAGPMADRAVVLAGGRVARVGAPGTVLADLPGAPPVAHLGHLLGWDPVPLTVRDARRHARSTPLPPELG
ncbi:MAG TPA: ABC transporter ATP-binding protein, partial [Iamia sp.]|nr:ABC transporter ATP-binding protein [Iamia sp.]